MIHNTVWGVQSIISIFSGHSLQIFVGRLICLCLSFNVMLFVIILLAKMRNKVRSICVQYEMCLVVYCRGGTNMETDPGQNMQLVSECCQPLCIAIVFCIKLCVVKLAWFLIGH